MYQYVYIYTYTYIYIYIYICICTCTHTHTRTCTHTHTHQNQNYASGSTPRHGVDLSRPCKDHRNHKLVVLGPRGRQGAAAGQSALELRFLDSWVHCLPILWMDGQMCVKMDEWMNACKCRSMNRWMDEWMTGWMDGWMDGWMRGRTVDGWMYGQMKSCLCSLATLSTFGTRSLWLS